MTRELKHICRHQEGSGSFLLVIRCSTEVLTCKESGQVLDCPATQGCTSMRWQTDRCCSGRISVGVKPFEIEGNTAYLHLLKVHPTGSKEVP